jgi:prevent-host-death family protein
VVIGFDGFPRLGEGFEPVRPLHYPDNDQEGGEAMANSEAPADPTPPGEKAEVRVGIGEVKRDISELVNRVAYGGERVVLTSRGKPKAVLISLEDYERLRQDEIDDHVKRLQEWSRRVDALGEEILKENGGRPIDVDHILEADRAERDARFDWMFGRE